MPSTGYQLDSSQLPVAFVGSCQQYEPSWPDVQEVFPVWRAEADYGHILQIFFLALLGVG